MLVQLPARRSAVHVPVLLLLASALLCTGAGAMLAEGPDAGGVLGALFALVVTGLTLGQLRVLRVVDDELWSTGLYGRRRAVHGRGAIGVRVRASRGFRDYTLYLHDAETGEELELAQAMSQRGAERLRARLTAMLHPEGLPDTAAASRAVVEAREAEYAAKVAQAQALVEASTGGRHPLTIVVIVMGVVSLVAAIAVAIAMVE